VMIGVHQWYPQLAGLERGPERGGKVGGRRRGEGVEGLSHAGEVGSTLRQKRINGDAGDAVDFTAAVLVSCRRRVSGVTEQLVYKCFPAPALRRTRYIYNKYIANSRYLGKISWA